MTEDTQQWYASWFDTPFYHILYKDRDHSEAQMFMDNLTEYLNIPEQGEILDLACGKGRHSLYLNSLGYDVIGVDLSENSISFAKKFTNESLSFKVHDMRNSFTNQYNAIFNLFTSFGYFENDSEDLKTLQNIKSGLTKNGVAVIDFLNVTTTEKHLVPYECKTVNNIKFHIQKKIENGFIIKHISFIIDKKPYSYFEKVKYLDLQKFEAYFKEVGLKIKHIFGNYELDAFDEATSNRLIFVLS